MNYNIYIHVSQKHIDAGERHSCSKCPIGLAINECLGPDFSASVGNKGCIELNYSNRKICQYALPMAGPVSDFVWDFDTLRPVKPFTFILPNVNERMIAGL